MHLGDHGSQALSTLFALWDVKARATLAWRTPCTADFHVRTWRRAGQPHSPSLRPRTVARLFRTELSSTFTQWRQQVILAKAVSLAAGRMPMGQIAAELGYSPSAFSAMVRKSVGQPPGRFLGAVR